jgi:hypothetical protein
MNYYLLEGTAAVYLTLPPQGNESPRILNKIKVALHLQVSSVNRIILFRIPRSLIPIGGLVRLQSHVWERVTNINNLSRSEACSIKYTEPDLPII